MPHAPPLIGAALRRSAESSAPSPLPILVAVAASVVLQACTPAEPVLLAVDDVVAQSGLVQRLLEDLDEPGGPVLIVSETTGGALQRAHLGQVDLLLVAAPGEVKRLRERERVAEVVPLMHNEYAIIGRAADPAGVASVKHGGLALRAVNRAGASFVVPARGSAARFKLEALWELQTDRRVSPGFAPLKGGVRTATLASHAQGAYALIDRATRLTYMEPRGLRSRVLFQGGPEMANPYHLVLLRPAAGRAGVAARARQLFDALRGARAKRVVAGFGLSRYGEALYTPGEPKGKAKAMRQFPPSGPRPRPSGPHPGGAPGRPPGVGGLPPGHPSRTQPGAAPVLPPGHPPRGGQGAAPGPPGAMPPGHPPAGRSGPGRPPGAPRSRPGALPSGHPGPRATPRSLRPSPGGH